MELQPVEAKLTSPSILVASPQLQDPNFSNTVLLLVEHTKHGAFGLIINRPTEVPAANLIASEEVKLPKEIPAWTGGPVGTDSGLIMCPTVDGPIIEKEKLCEGLILSASRAALEAIANHANTFHTQLAAQKEDPTYVVANHPFRFIVGYAGWGPGQLDDELRYGSWIELPLDLNLIFHTPWSKMWDKAIASLGISPTKIVPTVQDYLH
jgi:putative transcriptional regulator